MKRFIYIVEFIERVAFHTFIVQIRSTYFFFKGLIFKFYELLLVFIGHVCQAFNVVQGTLSFLQYQEGEVALFSGLDSEIKRYAFPF